MSATVLVVLRRVLLLGFCIVLTGSLVGVAHGHKPPTIEFNVYGLNAAPDYVMFVYPVGGSWDDTPSSALTVIKEGYRIRLGRPSRTPALYLMKAAAFRSWRAAHPVVRQLDDDAAAEKLVHGKRVVRCDTQLRPTFEAPRLKLLKGNVAVCRIRQLPRQPGD